MRTVLRLEGLGVLALALVAYESTGVGWGLFALAFFAPDLSFLGYLGGPRIGSIAYNSAHSYLGPMLCLLLTMIVAPTLPLVVALIWGAHVGFDRALGYGLKYGTGFGFTHLGRVGRAARDGSVGVASPPRTGEGGRNDG